MNEVELHDEIKGIRKELKDISNGLFRDNGGTCLQTKVDRNTLWRKAMMWVAGFLLTALGVIAKLVI